MHPIIHQNDFSEKAATLPQRIISLVPSQTELLYDLGLGDRVTGITRFCVHPAEWLQTKTIVGGTKNVDLEKMGQLQPDLIIANLEENVKEQVGAMQAICPVYISDVHNFDDACLMIYQVGMLTGKEEEAEMLLRTIEDRFELLQSSLPATLQRAAYLIWRKPYMVAGGDTFINDMLQCCGLQNVFADRLRYPAVTVEDVKASGCRLLLLSSEPYPFRQKHIEELQSHLPEVSILLVDGEMFSWYGSRLMKAPDYFEHLFLH